MNIGEHEDAGGYGGFLSENSRSVYQICFRLNGFVFLNDYSFVYMYVRLSALQKQVDVVLFLEPQLLVLGGDGCTEAQPCIAVLPIFPSGRMDVGWPLTLMYVQEMYPTIRALADSKVQPTSRC